VGEIEIPARRKESREREKPGKISRFLFGREGKKH
jgi:hypothetical protein